MPGPIIFAIIFLSLCAVIIIIDVIAFIRQIKKFSIQASFKYVDRFLLILSCTVIPVSFLWDINYLQYKAPVEHSEWKSITFNDFRGFKRPYQTLDGGTKFAFVCTSIDVSQSSSNIEIRALFHPARSYVFNREIFNEDGLTHELYHFHVTEYFARLLRKELIEQLEVETIDDLDERLEKILIQEQVFQTMYDEVTYHGYLVGKQIEWQEMIDSSLNSLSNYSQTIISLEKINE